VLESRTQSEAKAKDLTLKAKAKELCLKAKDIYHTVLEATQDQGHGLEDSNTVFRVGKGYQTFS